MKVNDLANELPKKSEKTTKKENPTNTITSLTKVIV